MESVSLKTNVWVKKCHVIQHFSTFARALKSAKPPPKDSVPNTAANGSEKKAKVIICRKRQRL